MKRNFTYRNVGSIMIRYRSDKEKPFNGIWLNFIGANEKKIFPSPSRTAERE